MQVFSQSGTLLTATENGYGKRTLVDEYPLRRRGGKGVITIKTSDRNGLVIGILLVEESDDLMLMTSNGKLIRIPAGSVSLISRNTQVTGVARVAEE